MTTERKETEETTCRVKKAATAAGRTGCAVPRRATRDDHCHLSSPPGGVSGEHVDLEVQ